jgi:hypothetical protein
LQYWGLNQGLHLEPFYQPLFVEGLTNCLPGLASNLEIFLICLLSGWDHKRCLISVPHVSSSKHHLAVLSFSHSPSSSSSAIPVRYLSYCYFYLFLFGSAAGRDKVCLSLAVVSLEILLPPPHECWDYRHVPSDPPSTFSFLRAV